MSMEGILLSVLLPVAVLHLVLRWRLLAFVVAGIERMRAQGVAAAAGGCVARGRPLWRVVRGATSLTMTVWGAERHACDPTTPGHVTCRGDGRPCLFTFVLAVAVTFGVLANALLLLGASVGAVLSRITTTARMVAFGVAVVLVGVVERVVAVGTEEPAARRSALGDLRVGTVWNGGSTGHGPGDASLPERGPARGQVPAAREPPHFATGST
jgi:hypothetical protein